MHVVHRVLSTATAQLASVPHSSPRLEAELLLSEVLGQTRSYLLAWPDHHLTRKQCQTFAALVRRRLGGEPIAYILGHREFWSLDLEITPDVLVPRPETELLVELALDAFAPDSDIVVADLGTGSGAIAAALAHERPRWRIFATDISTAALSVAKKNFRRLGLDSIETLSGAWCTAFPDHPELDLIVANPPYVAARDPSLQRGDTRREPYLALTSGPDGLDAIRAVVSQAPTYLRDGGILLLEHGFDQGAAVRTLLHDGGFTEVRTRQDLAGWERVSGGRSSPHQTRD